MEKIQQSNAVQQYLPIEEIECRYCNGRTAIYWRSLSFWKCPACRLIFRHPLPETESVIELYVNSWSEPLTHTSETGGTSMNLARIYVRKIAESLGVTDFSGLKILDFGAGRGDVLIALSEMGAEVYGVEPFGYQRLLNMGFKIFRTLDEIPSGVTFDGIVTMDVVEHLGSPWQEIARFDLLLKKGGFIYISTPNANSLRAKIQGDRWKEAMRAGHFVLFTESSLETILDKSGYKNRKRLKWYIQYNKSRIQNVLGYLLQSVLIDGELRYLIRKS
jgi:2-polyprenyl-3-methyl-5-hydroxy-6-metoxy-1,4-benzoquinol methylase